MIGIYKYDDCTVTDPTVKVIDIGRDLTTGLTNCEVYMHDESDGATFIFSDEREPTEWTVEAVQTWVEDYLQRYKV